MVAHVRDDGSPRRWCSVLAVRLGYRHDHQDRHRDRGGGRARSAHLRAPAPRLEPPVGGHSGRGGDARVVRLRALAARAAGRRPGRTLRTAAAADSRGVLHPAARRQLAEGERRCPHGAEVGPGPPVEHRRPDGERHGHLAGREGRVSGDRAGSGVRSDARRRVARRACPAAPPAVSTGGGRPTRTDRLRHLRPVFRRVTHHRRARRHEHTHHRACVRHPPRSSGRDLDDDHQPHTSGRGVPRWRLPRDPRAVGEPVGGPRGGGVVRALHEPREPHHPARRDRSRRQPVTTDDHDGRPHRCRRRRSSGGARRHPDRRSRQAPLLRLRQGPGQPRFRRQGARSRRTRWPLTPEGAASKIPWSDA